MLDAWVRTALLLAVCAYRASAKAGASKVKRAITPANQVHASGAAIAAATDVAEEAGLPVDIAGAHGAYHVIPGGYNQEEPPERGMTVYASMVLEKFRKVEPATNGIDMSARILSLWLDQRLQLDVEDFNGSDDSITINPMEVWTPDIALQEAVDSTCVEFSCMLLSGARMAELVLSGHPAHNLHCSQLCQWTVKCQLSMGDFPFDVNSCNLSLAPKTVTAYSLVPANLSASHLVTEEFEVIMEDHLHIFTKEFEVAEGVTDSAQGIQVTLTLARYSRFYMLNLICPLAMIVFLAWIAYFLPIEKTDRLAYCVTLVLATMAIQFISADRRPAECRDGWVDEFTTAVYIMLCIPILQTALLFRMESLAEFNAAQQSGREAEYRNRRIMHKVASRMSMLDRVFRLVHPVLMVILFAWGFGPGSPYFRARHASQAPTSWTMVWELAFVLPILVGVIWCTGLHLYSHGPWSLAELVSSLRDGIVDPGESDKDQDDVDGDTGELEAQASGRGALHLAPQANAHPKPSTSLSRDGSVPSLSDASAMESLLLNGRGTQPKSVLDFREGLQAKYSARSRDSNWRTPRGSDAGSRPNSSRRWKGRVAHGGESEGAADPS